MTTTVKRHYQFVNSFSAFAIALDSPLAEKQKNSLILGLASVYDRNEESV